MEDLDLSEISDDAESETEMKTRDSQCVVCLQPKDATYLFMPCKHANCCRDCIDRLEQHNQRCPTCRTQIECTNICTLLYFHISCLFIRLNKVSFLYLSYDRITK